MINFSKFNIETQGRTSGRMKTYCPQCRGDRKNKRDKSLSVNLDMGVAYCHYCHWKCNAHEKEKTIQPVLLVPTAPAVLRDEHVQWFQQQRRIPTSVLIKMGITSAEEYMPQTRKKESCVCFNYYEGNRLVNTKYRDLSKNFKLTAGAELIPYNINGILGTPECIINEGEIDALSFVAIGRTDVISVPAGANCNLSWIDRFIESHFEDKKVIYICTDTDRKGVELRNELIRRLGVERCRVIDLAPYKDANEVLCAENGAEMLKAALANAQQVPLEGVYTVDDRADNLRTLFENGLGKGAESGFENLDKLCSFELGRLCVVSGIPGCGKSEFIDELVLRLCLRHHWRTAYFSPENMPLEYHWKKLIEKLIGKRFGKTSVTETEYKAAVDFLQTNITSILPKDDYTADNILAKARELVHRRGIRMLVIDPFNRLEHRIPAGQTETQYISAFLDGLTNFAQRNHCLVILVAHPRKMNREAGSNKKTVPDLYDINGSAAFYNKCDFGLVVERDREAKLTRVHVEKVKFKHLGDTGIAAFRYNPVNGRYTEYEATTFNNESWLKEEAYEQSIFNTPDDEHEI